MCENRYDFLKEFLYEDSRNKMMETMFEVKDAANHFIETFDKLISDMKLIEYLDYSINEIDEIYED